MSGRNLSQACYWDHCGECRDGTCECICHDGERYDLAAREWYEEEEEEEDP